MMLNRCMNLYGDFSITIVSAEINELFAGRSIKNVYEITTVGVHTEESGRIGIGSVNKHCRI